MSMAYEETGRTAQKRRTREALVVAARQLIADGSTPTVEAAAQAASISRPTAYRYFPNQRALLAAAHPETEAESLLPANPPNDVAVRLDLVLDEFSRMILETEPQQRAMLRLSLEADPVERSQLPLRQGRAIRWIEEALAPLEPDLNGSQRHRLAVAIRAATGIEALVWLTDIAGLAREDAVRLMRWSARALLQAADADPTSIDQRPPARKRNRQRAAEGR